MVTVYFSLKFIQSLAETAMERIEMYSGSGGVSTYAALSLYKEESRVCQISSLTGIKQ